MLKYITTWDMTGEGDYRKIKLQADDWAFGGDKYDSPKILDSLKIEL